MDFQGSRQANKLSNEEPEENYELPTLTCKDFENLTTYVETECRKSRAGTFWKQKYFNSKMENSCNSTVAWLKTCTAEQASKTKHKTLQAFQVTLSQKPNWKKAAQMLNRNTAKLLIKSVLRTEQELQRISWWKTHKMRGEITITRALALWCQSIFALSPASDTKALLQASLPSLTALPSFLSSL